MASPSWDPGEDAKRAASVSWGWPAPGVVVEGESRGAGAAGPAPADVCGRGLCQGVGKPRLPSSLSRCDRCGCAAYLDAKAIRVFMGRGCPLGSSWIFN